VGGWGFLFVDFVVIRLCRFGAVFFDCGRVWGFFRLLFLVVVGVVGVGVGGAFFGVGGGGGGGFWFCSWGGEGSCACRFGFCSGGCCLWCGSSS